MHAFQQLGESRVNACCPCPTTLPAMKYAKQLILNNYLIWHGIRSYTVTGINVCHFANQRSISMTMQQFRKFAIPVAAAAVLALNGVAYAGTGTSPEQTPEKPVDCKKTPNDPKCINK